MRLAGKAIGLGVGLFVLIQVLSFASGLVLLQATMRWSGDVPSMDPNVQAALVTWNGIAVIGGAGAAFAIALAWWVVERLKHS